LLLSDAEKKTLADIGHRLGRKALENVANAAKPDTVLGWYRKLPARSPNSNAYAERWVRSVKEEALSKLILFSEASLRRVLREYVAHFHQERNHQGKGNVLLFPSNPEPTTCRDGPICCRERLGGLLKYYHRQAA